MQKSFSLLVGLALVGFGVLALACNLSILPFAPWLAVQTAGRLWPFLVLGLGVLFVLPAIVGRRRGLGGLWIPGVPLLVTGALLLFTNTTGWWGSWSMLWPLEVLALALGFLLAAVTMRQVWLVLPAVIVGLNGAVLLFCAVTHLWEAWAVLWTVEPLSVGLGLLVVSALRKSTPLFITGMLLSGLAALAFLSMTAILGVWQFLPLDWRLLRAISSLGVIGLGALLVGFSLLRPRQTALQG
jgi:hypothetical protein